MLEQFRALQAALRLEEFTIKQLAEASAVAPGTLQRMLKRRQDLFEGEDGSHSGQRGRAAKTYRIKPELVRSALRQAAGNIEMPDLPAMPDGQPFGIELARDTLLRQLPEAVFVDRTSLVAAAGEQLELASDASSSGRYTDLRDLHKQLAILVDVQNWIVKDVAQKFEQNTYASLVSVIEALISREERKARAKDEARLERTIKALSDFPHQAARLQYKLESTNVPTPTWWLEASTALWSLLRNSLWQDVVGDLLESALLLPTIAQHVAQTTEAIAELDPVPHDVILNAAQAVTIWDPYPVGLTDFHAVPDASEPTVFTGLRPARFAVVEYHSKTAGHFSPLHELTSRHKTYGAPLQLRSNFHVKLGAPGPLVKSSQHAGGLAITSLNLDLKHFAVASVELDSVGGDLNVPYDHLRWNDNHFVNQSVLTSVYTSNTSGGLLIAGKRVTTARGVCVLSAEGLMQIRLDPGYCISVIDVTKTALGRIGMGGESRAGTICWIDFQIETGQLARMYMFQNHGAPVAIPPSDLDYDADRNCFLLRPPGDNKHETIMPSHLAAKLQQHQQDLGLCE